MTTITLVGSLVLFNVLFLYYSNGWLRLAVTIFYWFALGLVVPALSLKSLLGSKLSYDVVPGQGESGPIHRNLLRKDKLAVRPHPDVKTLFDVLSLSLQDGI